MEKIRIYRKGRRVLHLYVVVVLMVTVLLARQLMLFFNIEDLSITFEDHIKKMGIELFVQSTFSLSPNLEYMCTTKNDGETEKLNFMMIFTSNFMPFLTYLVNTNITSYDYMCEIYPYLEKQQKEGNILETFAEDEKFIIKEGVDSVAVQATSYTLEQLSDYNFMLNNLYIIDTNVIANESLFDVKYYMEQDLSINTTVDGPQILIYHTHSQESFIDSRQGEKTDTIVGVGDELVTLLQDQYGFKVYHLREEFDLVDGVFDRSKAYDLIQLRLEQILKENPSIQVCIDVHRDGVPDNTKLVTTIDDRPTAKIMFFNGLSKRIEGDKMVEIDNYKNPYVKDNMSFSFQMQLAAKELYPNFTRKIYIKATRYNLHNLPRSILIEVGAQTNTVEEAKNAMIPLSKILSQVLK